MSTVMTVFERRAFSRSVAVAFDEGEGPIGPYGDRQRGSNERKNARITEIRIVYYWSFQDSVWKAERAQRISFQQQTKDGWGVRRESTIWGGELVDGLIDEYRPQTTVTLTEA